MLRVVAKATEPEGATGLETLDAIAREGPDGYCTQESDPEGAAYLERHQERDAPGHTLVVRKGKSRPREVTCGAGTLTVETPRVNDRWVNPQGQRQRFTSRILPPYMRRSPKVAEVLPVLYLRGLSTGNFFSGGPVDSAARGRGGRVANEHHAADGRVG
ncbi:MAG TPA: hypothetical protein VFK13_11355 [Gemmatimonadaceae bacterium]|nr:hypothetical protein [Gemmatimonadaceae bacterium]